MRVFSGTVFGYLMFELLWRAVFAVTDTDMHAPGSISFELGAIVFGLLVALSAGYLASVVGGQPHFIAAWMAGGLIALTAVVVIVRKGAAWPQVAALLLMAPAVVVGGYSYVLRQRASAGKRSDR